MVLVQVDSFCVGERSTVSQWVLCVRQYSRLQNFRIPSLMISTDHLCCRREPEYSSASESMRLQNHDFLCQSHS